jgi:glutamate formiminotransferase
VLLESVPNVSLGPQDEALDDVLGCVREATTPGCRLLDVHTDRDHRRTVLTLAGAPVPLVRVLTELADALGQQASLAGHDGVHPRVGLLDVVPFVALEAPREAAHRAARAFGQRMSTREVPVYGYAESSPTAQARPLAAIRRAMEGAELGEPAPLKPQQGPARPHPAMGATCVGVRDPLIAYNVVLDTDDIEVGRSIARSVRASSGGLVGLQALAFRLGSREDRVQVSTNITDADRLSLADVYEAVEQAADEAGVDVLEGELVGLAPSKALPKKAKGAGLRTRPVSLEDALLDAGYNVDEER